MGVATRISVQSFKISKLEDHDKRSQSRASRVTFCRFFVENRSGRFHLARTEAVSGWDAITRALDACYTAACKLNTLINPGRPLLSPSASVRTLAARYTDQQLAKFKNINILVLNIFISLIEVSRLSAVQCTCQFLPFEIFHTKDIRVVNYFVSETRYERACDQHSYIQLCVNEKKSVKNFIFNKRRFRDVWGQLETLEKRIEKIFHAIFGLEWPQIRLRWDETSEQEKTIFCQTGCFEKGARIHLSNSAQFTRTFRAENDNIFFRLHSLISAVK